MCEREAGIRQQEGQRDERAILAAKSEISGSRCRHIGSTVVCCGVVWCDVMWCVAGGWVVGVVDVVV